MADPFQPNPPLPDLEPGDVFLYAPEKFYRSPLGAFVGWNIARKTWTWLSHCEAYRGGGKVVAARTGGVDIYSERVDDRLRFIRRPVMESGQAFDTERAYAAIMPYLGKPYQFFSLFRFYQPLAQHHAVSRVCSPMVTVYVQGGGCMLFNPETDPSDISPAQLWQTPHLRTIWEKLPSPK